MTEYWLQKKTIGGWSMVTWHDDAEQAKRNYENCIKEKGYAWRLVEVTMLHEHRLEEEVQVQAPELEVKTTSWGATVQPKPISGWGNMEISTKVIVKPNQTGTGWNATPTKEHGMVGKVWMLNHQLKERARVNPDEVESRKANGWIVGGPKTAFEGYSIK